MGFDSRAELSFTNGSMSASVHIDNKNKDILILGEGLTQGLNYTTLIAEAKYSIDSTKPRKRLKSTL